VVYIIIPGIAVLNGKTANSPLLSIGKIIGYNNRVFYGAPINNGLVDVLFFTACKVEARQGDGLSVDVQVFVVSSRPHQYRIVHGRRVDGFLDNGKVAGAIGFYCEDGGEEGRGQKVECGKKKETKGSLKY